MTRVGIAGGGIAGSLLAWRLASAHTDWSVDLIAPAADATDGRSMDATEASGGQLRAFETDPHNCRMAALSLAEVASNPTLAAWSEYRETPSVYVCDGSRPAKVEALVAEVERRLPGSARIVDASELQADYGWHGLPADAVGVVEQRAGYFSPACLRAAVVAALPGLGVDLVDGVAQRVAPRIAGGVSCEVGSPRSRGRRNYDLFIVAAGRWTPRLLLGSDLPAYRYRTKLVQYGVYATAGRRPPAFVDGTSQLYGRPVPGRRILLGVASHRWGVDPDRQTVSVGALARTAALTASRFPGLQLGRLITVVTGADCYVDPPRLELRPAVAGRSDIFTFSGGSGGAAKTALAASAMAGEQLGLLQSEGSGVTRLRRSSGTRHPSGMMMPRPRIAPERKSQGGGRPPLAGG
jgi:glycine/D-amino acid oxidase-like deaminating enzyme